MNLLARSRTPWPWTALGLAGSVLVAVGAPGAVADGVVGWWYHPGVGRGPATALVYGGMAALCVAWLMLGRRLPSTRALIAIAALWTLPLALAPPLFSRDVYSYLAQGTILHLGLNPYHTVPRVLGSIGHEHVLDAVSTFWRGTTAPYGPLFLELISAIAGVTGSHLVGGALLTRAVELIGLGLLAAAMPRLARAMGSDGPRAVWLVVLSPLTTLGLLAAGHNDLLMVGLLATGVAVALEGRPLPGVAVCALAASVKVPALAGALFIIVAWGRAEAGTAARLRFAAAGAAVAAAVLGAVTVASGVGVAWISTALFSTPARVHLAITPATAIGYTIAGLLHDVGIAVSARGLEDGLGKATFALTVVFGAWALWRVRVGRLLMTLGGFLLVVAAGGPAAWPWYFSWGLALVAALRSPQRSWALAGALAVSAFAVKPDGILMLPRESSPAVLAAYVVIAFALWRHRRTRPRRARRPVPAAAPKLS
jgi:hypothetical protein